MARYMAAEDDGTGQQQGYAAQPYPAGYGQPACAEQPPRYGQSSYYRQYEQQAYAQAPYAQAAQDPYAQTPYTQPVVAAAAASTASCAQPEPPRKKKGRLPLFIMIVCIIIMLVCAGVIAKVLFDYQKVDLDFEEVRAESGRDIGALQALNPDAVGWIYVADTNIDYPVVFTPDDPEYYLHRNFDQEYSFAGTPFVGEGCKVPGGNSTIIYGHHMRNQSMFATLLEFEDEDFFNTHEIVFTTTEGEGTYKPIAAFHTDLSGGDDYYHYWDHVGELLPQDYRDFVNTVESLSMFSPTVEANFGHDLITLSTCSYGTSEERFAVVAVRVDK